MSTTTPVYSALGGDPDLADLVDLFVSEIPDRLSAIDEALAAGDWARVGVLSHQLKGAAGSYGFPELSRLAREVETAAKQNAGQAALQQKLQNLVAFCRRLRSGAPA